MSLESRVLLSVVFVDALIVGICIWSARRLPGSFAERRRQAIENAGLKGLLLAAPMVWFSAYELHRWYMTNTMLFGGRWTKAGDILLTDDPVTFALAGVVYSLGLLMFGLFILSALVEITRAFRED